MFIIVNLNILDCTICCSKICQAIHHTAYYLCLLCWIKPYRTPKRTNFSVLLIYMFLILPTNNCYESWSPK